MSFEIRKLLKEALERGASDVHVVPGLQPLLRMQTFLEKAEGYPIVTPMDTEHFVREMAGERRFEVLSERRDIDFSAQINGFARFRVNAHIQHDTIGIAFHVIPKRIPELDELGLPPTVKSFVDMPRGLILVTGQTGDGKSTTLAAMIEAMNQKHARHVITIEDPVEYLIPSKKCLIEQREIGRDLLNFAEGLRNTLRQDPDMIMVGEMRDLETTSAAITAAETGHLVLSTMHTQSAFQTVERIIDIYPGDQQNLIRAVLSNTLQAVISQSLFKRIDKSGMALACGVMICTRAVRNCIREDRIHEIPNIIQTSRDEGMCSLDDSVQELYLKGYISQQQVLAHLNRPMMLSTELSA